MADAVHNFHPNYQHYTQHEPSGHPGNEGRNGIEGRDPGSLGAHNRWLVLDKLAFCLLVMNDFVSDFASIFMWYLFKRTKIREVEHCYQNYKYYPALRPAYVTYRSKKICYFRQDQPRQYRGHAKAPWSPHRVAQVPGGGVVRIGRDATRALANFVVGGSSVAGKKFDGEKTTLLSSDEELP